MAVGGRGSRQIICESGFTRKKETKVGKEAEGGELTGLGCALGTGFETGFATAGEFAEELVPSGEGNNAEERHDEGERAGDVPPTKDKA